MLTVLFYGIIVTGAWAALIFCAWEAARNLARQLDARALAAQDGFTPSMARWGYVNEKRGRR